MGSVPVIDAAGECVGVLCGWDVVRAIGRGADLDSTTAAEVVGGDGVLHPDDDFEALGSTDVGNVVPVVEQDGSYVGAVGPADVMAARVLIGVLDPTVVPASNMTVRDVMSTQARTAAADDTLLDACRQMHVAGMGSVPVIDAAGGCVGVLATWDVVRAIAQGAGLDSTTAAEFVSADDVLHPDDDFDQALGANNADIVTPVVEDGLYLGAVSPGDILAAREVITVLGPAAAPARHDDLPARDDDRGHAWPLPAGGHFGARPRPHGDGKGRHAAGSGGDTRLPVRARPRDASPARSLPRVHADRMRHRSGGGGLLCRDLRCRARVLGCRPRGRAVGQQVDLIWVGSLFTHLDPARWKDFLDLFARTLRPGGVLVLSTFDRLRLASLDSMNLPDPKELLRERDERGVAFQSYVHDHDYGIALASADHVREALAFGGTFEFLGHEPLCLFQPLPTQDAWMYRRVGD